MRGKHTLIKPESAPSKTPEQLRADRTRLLSHRYYFYMYLYTPRLSYDDIMLKLENEIFLKADTIGRSRFIDNDIVRQLKADAADNSYLQYLYPHLNWQI